MVLNGDNLLLASPIKDMLPTKEKFLGVSYGLGEAGYDIRIKQDVWFNFRSDIYPIHALDNEPAYLGRFCIASAIEEFDMPTNLVGIVHDKSTWARQGLSVFNTVIEPGWKGFLTLELVYHGNKPLHIPAGSGIAQVIFHQTSNNGYYNGKYQNQKDEPISSKFE